MFGTAGISNMQSKRDEFNFNIKSHNSGIKCRHPTSVCPQNQECDLITGHCDCMEHYEWNINGNCQLCPSQYQQCGADRCCSSSLYRCIDEICQCDHPDCGSGVFVTASQVALSAALIMGIAALAMVVYRLCTRPKYLSARQRAALARSQGAHSSDSISGNDIRSSLSSMQIRVINRLRDRPPAYEGSNNNVTMDRGTNTGAGASTISASLMRNHVSTPLLIQQQNNDAPPPYINSENAPELELHRPPPYTEIILCPAGYLNESYVNTEDTVNHPGNHPGNIINISNDSSNDTNMDNCHNITINISDDLTSITKERNKDDLLNNNNNNNNNDTKDKESKESNNNKIDEKDNNNNDNNSR